MIIWLVRGLAERLKLLTILIQLLLRNRFDGLRTALVFIEAFGSFQLSRLKLLGPKSKWKTRNFSPVPPEKSRKQLMIPTTSIRAFLSARPTSISGWAFAILFCSLSPIQIQAATKTWDGSSSGAWGTGANWSGNTAPVSG